MSNIVLVNFVVFTVLLLSQPVDSREAAAIAFVSPRHNCASSSSSSSSSWTNNPRRQLDTRRHLYRPFADYAWKQLEETGWFQNDNNEVPEELRSKVAPTKGSDSVVQIETRALLPTSDSQAFLRYARLALLESQPNTQSGIQVLNLVIFPSNQTNLPVWGVDLVSLPGNRHLILMDAQPMVFPEENNDVDDCTSYFDDWYAKRVAQSDIFPWGGDIPPKAAKYVSSNALWTRLVATTPDEEQQVVSLLQNQLFEAFTEHLHLYLDLLTSQKEHDNTAQGVASNQQKPYIQYRLENDPAKPMLKSLYGEEWTERVLCQVLFPESY